MNRTQRNILDSRLAGIRVGLLHLNKFGMSYDYYMRELAIMENMLKKLRRDLEREEMQLKMEV